MAWLKILLRNFAVGLGVIRRPELVSMLVYDHPAPGEMRPGVIYIVGGHGYQKWAVFRCPFYHDEIVQLSLMGKHRPRWSIRADIIGRPTIHPSVRQLDGSFAHFWIKGGHVEWCADSGCRRSDTQEWTTSR